MSVRRKVEFTTPANDAYQAAAAVATPSQPPTFVQPSEAWNAPIVRNTKVSVSSTNTVATAALTRSDPTAMYAVKIVHPSRNVPTVSATAAGGTSARTNFTKTK